jgi:aspartate aminotransferase
VSASSGTPSPPRLSRRATALAPSATLEMVARVKALQARGVEILDLTAGEPDFAPPEAAAEGARAAIAANQGRYTAAAGMPELRAAVAARTEADFGLRYAPEQIVVTSGAKIAIGQALLCLVDPGEEVLIPSPYWTSYPEMVKLAEGVPVIVPCDAAFRPQVAALEAAWTPRTRALLLNTPSNPTGAVYPEALLAEIGAWALRRGVPLISDEIYASLTYGVPHVSPLRAAPGLLHTSVWIGGMSKAFAMTGWRMGFLAGPPALAGAVARMQSQLASSPNAISQHASLAALRGGLAERDRMRTAFAKRAELVVKALRAIPGLECPQPEGAFYAFPRLGAHLGRKHGPDGRLIATGEDFAALLLELDGVAVMGGSAFGAPDAVRLSFATSERVLTRALEKIAARLASLRE